MRTVVTICIVVAGLAALPGVISTAHAQNGNGSIAERVEELSEEGAAHFAAEEYEEAIRKFEIAYEIEAVPNLLYNIGRCYEQLDEWDDAIHYFEEFIRSPDIETEARDHAMDRVQSLREIRRAEADSDEYDSAEEDAEQQEELAREVEDLDDDEQIDEPDLIPAYATLGAGGALIVGGVVTGLSASSNADQALDSGLEYQQRLDAQNSARTRGYIADGLYVAGAVSLAAGTYLLLTASADSDTDTDRMSIEGIAPWFDGDYAGIGLTGGF